MKQIVLKLITIVALLTFISACSRNPVTGKKELSLMSPTQEQAMGDQADPSIQAAYGMYDDQSLQDFINEKGKAMGKISHLPDMTYNFRLLDSPVVNAFAVPGGYVYFTRGIMAHFNNEAEFAGVLGHEIGHITARHSAKQQTQQTLGQLGFMVGVIASEKFRVFANEANQGLGLLFLKNGRDHESQSDELGVRYSTMIGYDSHQMADFFQTLSRLSAKSGQSIPDFLSTHPNPVNRYSKVHEMSEETQSALGLRNLKVNRNEYLRRIDGLVYGEDPRQGYVERDYFYHPTLKFEFPTPRGWQVQNSPQQVSMAPEDGKAMMIFTLSPEKTLDGAAQGIVKQFNLNVIDQANSTINGYPARILVSDIAQDPNAQPDPNAQQIRIGTYLIKKDNFIYVFHGVAERNDFNTYSNTFKYTATNFDALTDQSKINVSPTTIKIATVPNTGTLNQVFKALNVSQNDYNELSIVNGMLLTDTVEKGMLIKTFSKEVNSKSSDTGTNRTSTDRKSTERTSEDKEPATTPSQRNTESKGTTNGTTKPTRKAATRKGIKRGGDE